MQRSVRLCVRPQRATNFALSALVDFADSLNENPLLLGLKFSAALAEFVVGLWQKDRFGKRVGRELDQERRPSSAVHSVTIAGLQCQQRHLLRSASRTLRRIVSERIHSGSADNCSYQICPLLRRPCMARTEIREAS